MVIETVRQRTKDLITYLDAQIKELEREIIQLSKQGKHDEWIAGSGKCQ